MRNLFIWTVALCVGSAAGAQAFGVEMGAPVSRYAGHHIDGIDDRFYFAITVPEPNGEFDSYAAIATPQTGVCKVSGLGKNHDDSYGYETRSAFKEMASALTGKYGPGKEYDFLNSGAIWDEPREWNWSIYKKERTLISFWSAPNGSTLPPEVAGVSLEVKSVNPESSYLVIHYELANFDRCKALMDNANNSGL